MDKPISVRKLYPNDAKAIALLHHQSFKGFFLTSLGINFLEVFYRSVLLHRQGLGFGVFKESELVGFSLGAQQNTGFYTSVIKQHWLSLIWSALPKLLNPLKVKRLLSSFRSPQDSTFTNVPVLLSICVSKNHESKGFGGQLLQIFESDLLKLGHKSLLLSTDADNNVSVNKFYQHNNYTFVKSYFQGKREMNLYYKQLIP